MGELVRCFSETVDGVLLSSKATGDGRCNLFCVGIINNNFATHNSSYKLVSRNIEATVQGADDVCEQLICIFF
jgi:hypothetical protein